MLLCNAVRHHWTSPCCLRSSRAMVLVISELFDLAGWKEIPECTLSLPHFAVIYSFICGAGGFKIWSSHYNVISEFFYILRLAQNESQRHWWSRDSSFSAIVDCCLYRNAFPCVKICMLLDITDMKCEGTKREGSILSSTLRPAQNCITLL